MEVLCSTWDVWWHLLLAREGGLDESHRQLRQAVERVGEVESELSNMDDEELQELTRTINASPDRSWCDMLAAMANSVALVTEGRDDDPAPAAFRILSALICWSNSMHRPDMIRNGPTAAEALESVAYLQQILPQTMERTRQMQERATISSVPRAFRGLFSLG